MREAIIYEVLAVSQTEMEASRLPYYHSKPAKKVLLDPFPGEETDIYDFEGIILALNFLDFPPWVFLPEPIPEMIEVRTCCPQISRKQFQWHGCIDYSVGEKGGIVEINE